MNRRSFLGGGAGAYLADAAAVSVIDAHIHLFDPARPQGVPWPSQSNRILYQPALPDRYRRIAAPLGIVGAIEVECSPWLEDNQWVLDVAARDTMIVGTVGNLEPGKPEFGKQLERLRRNELFRGIRYGNLWGRNLGAELPKPEFIAGLKLLAEAGLVLDTANPNPTLLADVVRVSDRVPTLRVVIDHLPQLEPPAEPAALRAYQGTLKELAARPQVYVKVSEVLRRIKGQVPVELSFYRPRIDELMDLFGTDRLIYGSDWPNSDQWGPYELVLNIVREYFMSKGRETAEKYFWKNSAVAYRWVKRDSSQPA